MSGQQEAGDGSAPVPSRPADGRAAVPADLGPPVVGPEWLAARRDDVVVVDVRADGLAGDGRERWLTGHLPGARLLTLEGDLAGVEGEGRLPLPTPEAFARALGGAGIAADDTVVAYDVAGGPVAARLVVLLRAIGQRASLLDGGLAGWAGEREQGPVAWEPVVRAVVAWPGERVVGLAAVRDLVAQRAAVLVDSRPADAHVGDPSRARGLGGGHIPGSVSVPVAATLDGAGRLLPREELREVFARAGVGAGDDVVAYCGAGVAAAHSLLALEAAGLGPGRLFVGSFSAWSAAPDLPIEYGPSSLGPFAGTPAPPAPMT